LDEETAGLPGITRESVDERRRAGTLLAVRVGCDWRYPACQFQDGEVDLGLTDAIRGLAPHGQWVTLDLLPAPDAVLEGRTPLQALREGDCATVLRLVRAGQDNGFA
jgi:hypothetical protein